MSQDYSAIELGFTSSLSSPILYSWSSFFWPSPIFNYIGSLVAPFFPLQLYGDVIDTTLCNLLLPLYTFFLYFLVVLSFHPLWVFSSSLPHLCLLNNELLFRPGNIIDLSYHRTKVPFLVNSCSARTLYSGYTNDRSQLYIKDILNFEICLLFFRVPTNQSIFFHKFMLWSDYCPFLSERNKNGFKLILFGSFRI